MQEENVDNQVTIQALIARIRELEDENKKLRHCLVAQWLEGAAPTLGVENE